jgi:hypothetical protein
MSKTKQRIKCFIEALPDFKKSALEYEAKKNYPNNFKKIK